MRKAKVKKMEEGNITQSPGRFVPFISDNQRSSAVKPPASGPSPGLTFFMWFRYKQPGFMLFPESKFLLAACLLLTPVIASHAQDLDGPLNAAATMGERLFLETRFAEYYFTNSGGNANLQLNPGDPVMKLTQTIGGPVPGPFAGQSMNCRACHLVDEFNGTLGNRTYCDFTPRSPVPLIGDGRTNTPRNSPLLVDALLPRSVPTFLHLDGQFATPHDLIIGTLTGRNYGWKPTEYAAAIAHIAHIIREDDGAGALAQGKFGGGYSYADVISPSADVPITKIYRLNFQYTFGDITITDTNDPGYVTDGEIVDDVAALIEQYLDTLVFAQDLDGNFIGSPFDVFLIKNGLPQQPAPDETPLQYSQRLLAGITNLSNPQYVTDPGDGHFTTQDQVFQFGPQELEGLKIFFALGERPPRNPGRTGNCVACHTPPAFSDFIFHNTGAAQEEYDSIHGRGAFNRLAVPGLIERRNSYDAYLPPTTNHPAATGRFITPPSREKPGEVDLGLWNVFANPDFPAPQPGLQQILPEIVPSPTPRIGRAVMAGNRFFLSGRDGAPGWTYHVLVSTNLLSPAAEWSIVSTNTFDSGGQFNFTGALDPNLPGVFYKLSVGPAPPEIALPYTIARFKTPTVRDLGQSGPYLHTGRKDTIEDVVQFYQEFSRKARAGELRNIDPGMKAVSLDDSALAPLAAFLRSLNEDYTD
jgi:cytochrome c peroxidase